MAATAGGGGGSAIMCGGGGIYGGVGFGKGKCVTTIFNQG